MMKRKGEDEPWALEPEAMAETVDLEGRWRDLDRLLLRPGYIVGPGFEPGIELRDMIKDDCRVLVIGAGGLGCELLKDLALTGFGNIEVIDMDTIDVSNLNRQFLFRMRDVGQPKAKIAAERVMERVKGVNVVPHYCRIEDKDPFFFRGFQIIVLGLDSLEARSYINAVVCGFLEYESDGSPDLTTIKPMVDGGTEGFKGHARVIIPGLTPCFQCSMWLFPPQVTFPLCTLAETPRSPAHCIEYVHLIQWGQDRPGETFDADNTEHMKWIFEQAARRAEQYNINGVTYILTQGVVKNIIPAIASTNAIVAATCALETLKIATMCSKGMDVFMQYTGTDGVYMRTFQNEKDPNCVVCSPGVPVEVEPDITLKQFIDTILKDSRFENKISMPSVSLQGENLYMQAPPVLEEETRPNLEKALRTLMNGEGGILNINDRKLKGTLRVQVIFKDVDMDAGGCG
ncbi:hypothetical protein R1flu_025470 [Riccia fluitans]|uniref:NEDD8-activating enzyme E1 catalytic subunit n=1 Tax=Riccia fluitans TaxID=41844 RepID=A0ABD1XXU9_9MARC